MKRLIATLLIVAILCNVGFTRLYDEEIYSFIPMKTGPDTVAYYKLWHGLTSTALVFDYSLNGNTGTATGAVPAYPGFSFDASDDQIICGSDSSIDDIFTTGSGGTISIWLKTMGKGENNFGRAIGKENWLLQANDALTNLAFSHAYTGDDGIWSFDISSQVWQHIALLYVADKQVNDPIVLVNGIVVAVSEDQQPGTDLPTSDAAETLIIGDNSVSNRSWKGSIGEVLLFDTLKSVVEMRNLYETSRSRYQR